MGIATATVSASNLPNQVTTDDPQGEVVFPRSTSLGAFFGGTPVPQPTSPLEATIPAGASGFGNAGGVSTLYTTSQSPSSVATITTAEQSITVNGVLATDLVIINKPTNDAGLAMAMGRVSAANTVKLVFANLTAGTLTPTASQSYLVNTISANLQLTATLTPAAVAANSIVEQTFPLTGVQVGQVIQVNKPTTQAGLAVLSARATANNTVGITFINPTAGTLTPTAAEVYLVAALNALPAASPMIEFGSLASPVGVATITVAEQSITALGIQATDVFVGVQKPTTNAGIGVVHGRVSAASTWQLTLVNPTAGTLTPTASEIYSLTVWRPNPSSVISLFSTLSLAPTSVAANTTAEQTFTVTGLTSGLCVAVSPLSNVSIGGGIGIAGVRASATNTLAISFVNTTANAIVPPAFLATVAQFNHAIPTVGGYVTQYVTPGAGEGTGLLNSLRTALVSLNLIKGS